MIPAFTMQHLLNNWHKKNQMLICTMASGERFIEMLKIMGPTVSIYADIHKMDSLILPLYNERLYEPRPYAWDKLVLINYMLNFYEFIVWIDSDCMICDPQADIRTAMYEHYPMYLTRQQLGGIVNTGVWVIRSNQQSRDILQAIWDNTRFIHHPWWEQAALLDLMGYQFGHDQNPNGVSFNPTPFSNQIGHLDIKWNSCCSVLTNETVIKHYCGPKNDDVFHMMRQDYHNFIKKLGN